MHENIKRIAFIACFLIAAFLRVSIVSAAEERVPAENVDSSEIKVHPKYDVGYADALRKEGKSYIYTKKSAGKMIPVKIYEDGVMIYCFASEEIKLFDEKKKLIVGREDDEGLGVDYVRHEESENATCRYSMPIKLVSVKKNETYYFGIPKNVPAAGYEVYAYLRPKSVPKLENGKRYISEGTGKYVYYPFSIKKSLAGLYIDGIFVSYGGGDTMCFKVQKKVGGKWKNITSVRSKLASLGQCGKTAPYGLSKGKYRFGIKLKKGQFAYIDVDIRNMKCNSSDKKSRPVIIKKGKTKGGIFTWGDKKPYWYKVVKSDKNKVKKLAMCVGGTVDKFRFTIYKKGKQKPLETIKFSGKNRVSRFVEYTTKSFDLKDNGTYYIKVSKENKRTNGAYKLSVK